MACYPGAQLHHVATCRCVLLSPLESVPVALGELQVPVRVPATVQGFAALSAQPRLSDGHGDPFPWDEYTEGGR